MALRLMNRLPKKRSLSSITIFYIIPPGLLKVLMKTKRDFLHSIGYLNCTKKTYKAQFIANSSSCTTTELSKLLGWLVGCFGFNGPLRQYFSLYRAVSQREGERGEKG